jgi:hypothetical protein
MISSAVAGKDYVDFVPDPDMSRVGGVTFEPRGLHHHFS